MPSAPIHLGLSAGKEESLIQCIRPAPGLPLLLTNAPPCRLQKPLAKGNQALPVIQALLQWFIPCIAGLSFLYCRGLQTTAQEPDRALPPFQACSNLKYSYILNFYSYILSQLKHGH